MAFKDLSWNLKSEKSHPEQLPDSMVSNNGGEVMAMNNERESKSERVKKPYQKPEIRKIELRPEEAVLGGCKIASSSGPAQATCTVPANCTVAMS